MIAHVAPSELTPAQRAIVEADDGPVVVIAGAGTGKTRVIVERVRWLLETKGATTGTPGGLLAAEPPRHGDAFAGPLLPEQLLVLTYNVKAAAELAQRIDAAVGVTTRARMTVSNFHSFCQRILTESSSDAGLPPRPDVLDGVGQLLLLQGLRGDLHLRYHGDWSHAGFVQFINRAKDELVTPADFDAFVAAEVDEYERRYGSFAEAEVRLETQGNLQPLRRIRGGYADLRARERAGAGTQDAWFGKAVDREARRTIAGDGVAHWHSWFAPEDRPRIDALSAEYERDAAALEVLRLTELARVYHAYEAALAARGALDFGEQIALVTRLFKTRPNVLRRWQRQFRYLLVDEFQDANVAQIELIELLGRTPDRPDNVMVVGDDDQSIYRFRGASFAAFAEFDARFSRPPTHDPGAAPPGPPRRMRLEQNFRSVERVLVGANRLIALNQTRFEPDKRLRTDREPGEAVELHVCGGPEDEAVAIVDAIRAVAGPDARAGVGRWRWTDVAVLYRKHKHRDAIVARLRAEDIPYTVVGGLSLFEADEIRDLEQALRAIADPHDDAALVRTMTGGPWRMDALEILRVTRAGDFDGSRVIEAARRLVATGEGTDSGERIADDTRAKLRRLLDTLDELAPAAFRDGPYTILERWLERTGQVLDLLAADTLEAKRAVTNIASLMRFAADWQAEHPGRSLADFTAYLDAYKAAGGELPTSVELSEDVDGVRLMTLYQAKGLEYPVVIVPSLLDGEWPVKEQSDGWFPRELLREQVPGGDLHTDEERRLLYVAMTRARERLILTTHGGPTAVKAQSRFVGELLQDAGAELIVVDRVALAAAVEEPEAEGEGAGDETPIEPDEADLGPSLDPAWPFSLETPEEPAELAPPTRLERIEAAIASARRVMPLPTARERRLALRLRASELVGLLEGTRADDPEGEGAREAFASELDDVGRSAVLRADEARSQGLDPLTMRTVALDSAAGANLLAVVPSPGSFSYTSLSTYERCPLQFAFANVYRMPPPDRPVAPFTFGSTAHETFEAFTRERRERLARGEAAPTRDDLERMFRERWVPTGFGDRVTEEGYARRVDTLLANFWEGELASLGEAVHEELDFRLVIDPGDGTPSVVIHGQIDRIDRLPSGGIEVIDYKTGKVSSQADVENNLQLSIYALACRDALGLGTPERVTLYFTESATRRSTSRTDAQLDEARAEILARVRPIRAGEFQASPGRACQWCDYRAMCSERV